MGKNSFDWEALLTEYPTFPGDYRAVPEPHWSDLSGSMSRFAPKGAERAVHRYVLRESNTLYNDARLTPAVLIAGLARIEQIGHPIVRGATWAAFATYHQFYLDGNKGTGRYVMNAVLMSHGDDAILIPERLKAQYEDALVDSYRTGDLTPHIEFLLNLYADD